MSASWPGRKGSPQDRPTPKAVSDGAPQSMKFDEADEIDDDALNAELWRAIRGTDPPAPTSSFFSR